MIRLLLLRFSCLMVLGMRRLDICAFVVLTVVEGLIPRSYPNSDDWASAVVTEPVQRKLGESDRTEKDVVDVWSNLGGPEMALFCVQGEHSSIAAVVGTLFLAGELASVLDALPSALAKDMTPICGLIPSLHTPVVNFASQSLYELGRARRNQQATISMAQVLRLTPLANLHLVCGPRVSTIPSIAQLIIKSATQRDLGVYRFSPTVLREEPSFHQAKRVIHEYPREALIAGAADVQHLETYFELLFDQDGLFHLIDGIYHLTQVNLDARDQVERYYMAGRALGLSMLYGVPLGLQLDPKLVEVLCREFGDPITLELRMVQSGFREIVSLNVLRSIFTKTVGDVLRGIANDHVSLHMLRSHMESNLNKSEPTKFFKALEKSPKYINLFVQLATGLRHIPAGGLASIVPVISVSAVSSTTVALANRENHSVILPRHDLKKQLIIALRALSNESSEV